MIDLKFARNQEILSMSSDIMIDHWRSQKFLRL